MQTAHELALSNNAVKVLQNRYLHHDAEGHLTETPPELFQRVAHSIAQAELAWGGEKEVGKWSHAFYELMTDLAFLPNSPTLMNAGTPLNQLSACFVLPVEDNLDAIFTTLKHAALIQQSGGGTGFNFSHLRPKGDLISITGGSASGPVSFMKVFNAATEHVKHGGKRRGANMGVMNVAHPDIEEFIQAKREEGGLNNFNISVGVTDAFMQAVESKDTWHLVHPGTGKTVKTLEAIKLWNLIVENAWSNGDPGLIFLDMINRSNPLPALGRIEATNPCGEVPLLPYESCNLGSLNLTRFVRKDASIHWPALEQAIYTAVRFLDDVIEVNNYLLPETAHIVRSNRKIGLGVMGWADLLILKQLPYDSDAALTLAHDLMFFIQQTSMEASAGLAKERGTFPNWNKSVFYPNQPMRHATLLSIAPTGTISLIADASSSIEPLFAIAYQRKNVLEGATLSEVNPYFIDYIREFDLYSPRLLEEVQEHGTLQVLPYLSQAVKNLFKTAMEITPEWHLKHQAVFQQYVDNAVSKTINLPESASVQDVERIYRAAWKQPLKGITIYRNASKKAQVLHQGISSETRACKVCAG